MALSSPRLLGFLAAAAALACCADPDPSYGDPGGILGKKVPNETSTGSSSSSSSGASSGANGPFPSAYDGTANRPAKTLVASHAAAASKGAPSSISSPLVCGDCHKEGGTAGAKAFAFGGRVMRGENGVPNVDVILTGPATVGPVKSDEDGFFWSLGTPIASGSKATIRSQAGMSAMTSSPQVSCDTTGCHQEAAQGRIGKNLP